MNAKDLKNSILQLAIQGKLVEQREEEGTAKELIQKIKNEKKQLVKEGKIKKEKPFDKIEEDEKPFEVPDNWEWIRFGDLGSYRKGPFGSALTKAIFVPKSENTVKVYEQKNAIQKDVYLGEYYITREYFESKMKGFELSPGDIIVSCAGTIGETYVMPDEFEQGIINQALMQMKLMPSVDVEYFLMYFDFILKKTARKSSKGSAIKNIPPFAELKNYVVPLPPLEEQKRIVAKIEELMPYVDKYDVAYSEVEELNKKFPEDMQKSILQYAIQGKLVEQREEDGTAAELYKQIQEEKKKLIREGKIKKTKALPEITEDEIPFDIPENWKWVRLGDCASNKSGVSYKKSNLSITTKNMVRILRGGNISELECFFKDDDIMIDASFVKDDLILLKNTLITPAVTSLQHIGKMARIDKNYDNVAVGGFVLMLMPHINSDIFSQYLLYALSSYYHRSICRSITNKSGQAFYNLSREKLMNVLVPLPPLEEQKRIVAKIKELIIYTRQLVKKLD